MNLEGFLTAFKQKTPWGGGTDADELALRLFRRLDSNADGSIEVCRVLAFLSLGQEGAAPHGRSWV